ncbi:PilZ domain-containing protein [Ornithinibacillus californiensis]|uniref:PilZ domain-containing protein n=1 Tax=Ornithinibacillus californiensis TaxID=161536 RepID=UPI00064DE995|nr:PilZ domain-containing protein [Ornithinibacillus californiensis]
MEYREWIYVLIIVVLLLLLSLYFLIKKFSKKPQSETTASIEKKETPRYPTFSGVNLRENFRVSLDDVHCFVEFLDVENEELNPKFFNGVLKNISVGGVKFVCDFEYPIEDDMMIKVRFSLKNSMFIVKGRIVRKELYPERDRFGYGVQFTNLFDEDRELLYQILNRIMVERRRKMVTNSLVGEESMV